jgi:hypothetical protein
VGRHSHVLSVPTRLHAGTPSTSRTEKATSAFIVRVVQWSKVRAEPRWPLGANFSALSDAAASSALLGGVYLNGIFRPI